MALRRELILLGFLLVLDVLGPLRGILLFVSARSSSSSRPWQPPRGQWGIQSPSLAPTAAPSSSAPEHHKKIKRTKKKHHTPSIIADEAEAEDEESLSSSSRPKPSKKKRAKKQGKKKKGDTTKNYSGRAAFVSTPTKKATKSHGHKKLKKSPESSSSSRSNSIIEEKRHRKDSTTSTRTKAHKKVKKVKSKDGSAAVKPMRPSDLSRSTRPTTYGTSMRPVRSVERGRIPPTSTVDGPRTKLSRPSSKENRKRKSRKKSHSSLPRSSPKAQENAVKTSHSERKKKSTKKKRKTKTKHTSLVETHIDAAEVPGTKKSEDESERDTGATENSVEDAQFGVTSTPAPVDVPVQEETSEATPMFEADADVASSENLSHSGASTLDDPLMEEAHDAKQSMDGRGSFEATEIAQSVGHVEPEASTHIPSENEPLVVEEKSGAAQSIDDSGSFDVIEVTGSVVHVEDDSGSFDVIEVTESVVHVEEADASTLLPQTAPSSTCSDSEESPAEETKDIPTANAIDETGSFDALKEIESAEEADEAADVSTPGPPTSSTSTPSEIERFQLESEDVTKDVIENSSTAEVPIQEEPSPEGEPSLLEPKSEISIDQSNPELVEGEREGEDIEASDTTSIVDARPSIDNEKNMDEDEDESSEDSDSEAETISSAGVRTEEGTLADVSAETEAERSNDTIESSSGGAISVERETDAAVSPSNNKESGTISDQDVDDQKTAINLKSYQTEDPSHDDVAHEGPGSKEASEDPYLEPDVVHFIGKFLNEDVDEVLAWTTAETSSNTDGGSNMTASLNETRGGSQIRNTSNITKNASFSDEIALDGGNSTEIEDEQMNTVTASTDKLGLVEVEVEVEMKEDDLKLGASKVATRQGKLLDRRSLETSEDKKTDAIVSVVTWNLAEESPSEDDAEFIRAFRKAGVKKGSGSDLVLISGQECENIKPRRTEGRRSREYRRLMIKMLGKDYVPIALHLLGGIQFGLFAKKSFLKEIEHVSIADVTCGIGNVFHNKGAIAAFLQLRARNPPEDSDAPRSKSLRMVFVTAHMAAHVKNSDARDADFWRISNELEAQSPEGFLPKQRTEVATDDRSFLFDSVDRAFFCGDLNYRIDLPREVTEYTILTGGKELAWDNLLPHDQLFRTMTERRAFPGFAEGNVKFAPTFKFDKDTGEYDTSHKQRIPAWTDRILFKPWGTRVLSYESVPGAQHSDHRPVHGTFRVNMEGRELPPKKKRRQKQNKKKKDSSE